jgi:hypothetical protein
VLEQRIARVHRMGQHRPVRVVNLVTRDSIEERVLRTVAMKRSLFQEVFAGTSDTVRFEAVGQGGFLDAVRELVGEEVAPAPAVPEPVAPVEDPRVALVQAGVQFLEALAKLLPPTANGTNGQGHPELMQRANAALQKILGE